MQRELLCAVGMLCMSIVLAASKAFCTCVWRRRPLGSGGGSFPLFPTRCRVSTWPCSSGKTCDTGAELREDCVFSSNALWWWPYGGGHVWRPMILRQVEEVMRDIVYRFGWAALSSICNGAGLKVLQ